ncbi:MAG: hypothetical protein ABI761_13640, partial [Saprospiraceae bacterium]
MASFELVSGQPDFQVEINLILSSQPSEGMTSPMDPFGKVTLSLNFHPLMHLFIIYQRRVRPF